jgi:hypothetical protein
LFGALLLWTVISSAPNWLLLPEIGAGVLFTLFLVLTDRSNKKEKHHRDGYTRVHQNDDGSEVWAKKYEASGVMPARVLLSHFDKKGRYSGYRVVYLDDVKHANALINQKK